jgi:hypothetical protein
MTTNRLQRIAFPLVLLAGACIAQADPIASIMLRQYQTASGDDVYGSFGAIDCQDSYAAVHATLAAGANGDFDTLIWYWDGTSGGIEFREGLVTVMNHQIIGDDFTVKIGQLGTTVGVNRHGDVAYQTRLRITCDEPDDPACDYDNAVAFMRNDVYGIGGADPALICGLAGYGGAEDARVDSLGNVIGNLTTGGLSPKDNIAKGIFGITTELICYGDPIGDSPGFWGRLKSATTLDVVSFTGQWYAIDQISQVPSDENLVAIVDGNRIFGESDDVYFWTDPTVDPDWDVTATVLDIDDIAISIQGELLWTGQLAVGGDITFDNNDVVGYGPFVILQEGQLLSGIDNALSVYFGRLSGGGAARYLATDDSGNVIWVLSAVATYPGDDWPDDPLDTYEELIDVIMYNGEVVLATHDQIDQNGDGNLDPNTEFLTVSRDLALDGVNEAWFIGSGLTSLGERTAAFRFNNLPNTDNPWHPLPDIDICDADLNGDNKVDQSDLGILLASYEIDDGGDVNDDGVTDQSDLGILLAEYEICGF